MKIPKTKIFLLIFLSLGLFLFGCLDNPENNSNNSSGNLADANKEMASQNIEVHETEQIYSNNNSNSEEPPSEYTVTPEANLKIYFIGLGSDSATNSSEAILIKKGDLDILVDASNSKYGKKLSNFLTDAQVDDIELFISTYDDPNRYSGLEEVSRHFKIGSIARANLGSEEYKDYLDSFGLTESYLEEGDTITLNNVSITVLAPSKSHYSLAQLEPNVGALILKVEDRDFCALLTSDASETTLNYVASRKLAKDCDVVEAPRYGLWVDELHFPQILADADPSALVITGSYVPDRSGPAYDVNDPSNLARLRERVRGFAIRRTMAHGEPITILESYLKAPYSFTNYDEYLSGKSEVLQPGGLAALVEYDGQNITYSIVQDGE